MIIIIIFRAGFSHGCLMEVFHWNLSDSKSAQISGKLLAEIMGSFCTSKSRKSLCVPFSRKDAGLCIYQWITWLTPSYLALHSFCANMLHSLIKRLVVSSLSPHNLHCYFVASYQFSFWYETIYYYYIVKLSLKSWFSWKYRN